MPSTPASPRAALETIAQRAVVVELALVVAALIAVSAYSVAVDAALDPYFLDSDTALLLLRSALVLLGIGVLTAAYAAWRGYSLRASMPATSDARVVGAAVAVAALLATPSFALLAVRTGTGVEHVASTLADAGAVFTLRTLTRIALFVAGMALLGHALVQGALGRVIGRGRAVVATTMLGGYLAAPTTITYGTFAAGPWLPAWGRRAAVALLFVLALGVVVAAERRVDDDRLRTLATLPLLAAVALVVLVLAAAADSPGGAVVALTRAAVIGVAAYAYDATDSLLVPALAYAAFAVVSRVLYAATIAAAFGG